jgi:hypothetical protein
MPTLREELEPLRRLVKGGNYAALRAMIEFIDAADRTSDLIACSKSVACQDPHCQMLNKLRALLDQQIE